MKKSGTCKGRPSNPHQVVRTQAIRTQIASLALGTGDIDCVYQFALTELRQAIIETTNEEPLQLLDIMIDGKRLREIADLPLDLLA